jgi:hypothetical protein
MARLPIPGSDSGDWGTILNTFLDVSLYNNVNNATDPDNGTLNSGVVGTAQIQNNAVTNTQLDSSTQTILSSVASKYVKPGGGIPYTDLAGNIPSSLLSSAVQTNLTSASTALQSSYTLSGGDLTGTIASPTVSKIKGVSISTPAGGTTSYLNASGTWTTPSGGGGLTLDTTASNILVDTTTGSAVAGNTGMAADAGHQHPLVVHDHSTSAKGGQISPSTGLATTSGTPSSTTYLRGDNTWSTPAAGVTLDSTNTDIQPLGSQSAGSSSLAAKADHVHPTTGLVTTSSSLGGDLSGTAGNATVSKLQGTSISTPTGGTTSYLNASGTWTTPSGGGNMNTSTYDPAGIAQQVVGTTATQTLTNKSISGGQITSAVANATNAVNATNATTATTASTVTTIPALTGDVTSGGSSNATTLTSSSNVETIISANTTVAGALQKTNNLYDVTDAGTSRANIHIPTLTPAAAVAVANVSLTAPGATIDGYSFNSGDLVLLTGQSTASQNGLYSWTGASSTLTRPTEMATGGVMKARTVAIIQGTTYGGTTWLLQTNSAITVDTSNQAWISISGTGSGGGITVASPSAYSRPLYTGSSWIADNPIYVDITGSEFGVQNNTVALASTDQAPAINAAIETLGKAGLRAYLPPGTYNIKSTVNIGDGSINGVATYTGWLEGGTVPVQTGVTQDTQMPTALQTTLQWHNGTGFTGSLVSINGPVGGWAVRNLCIDGNYNYVSSLPQWGLSKISCHNGLLENVAIINVKSGIQHNTVGQKNVGGVSANCSRNMNRNISVGVYGSGSGTNYGVLFDQGAAGGGNGNCCYEMFEGLWIENGGANGRTTYGVCFRGCDTIRLHNINIAQTSFAAQLAYDYTGNNLWPSGCVVDVAELGGAPIGAVEIGTPAGGGQNHLHKVEHVSPVNGLTPNPYLKNVAWGMVNLNGQATLVGGTVTVSGYPAIATGSNMVVRVTCITPGGTQGILSGTIPSNGTITINSTSNTDTSTVMWEVIANS